MSKTIKQSLVILIVLAVISIGVAFFMLFQKMALEKQNRFLQGQLSQEQDKGDALSRKIKGLNGDVKKLQDKLTAKAQEAAGYQQELDQTKTLLKETKAELGRISAELDRSQEDKSDLNKKLADLQRAKQQLEKEVIALKNKPPEVKEKVVEKIVYRDRPKDEEADTTATLASMSPPSAGQANEEYWAAVMREKAALELELKKSQKDLASLKLKVSSMTKINSDLELEIGRLKNEKEEIVHRIKYGEDLADNLSIELARARNDQKMALDRADKVETENKDLRANIKNLTTTKVALERSVARLTDEKADIERKLVETENIIQNRIDEIWKIKKDIDSRFDARGIKVHANEVELPPIVVNASSASRGANASPAVATSAAIVSVNEENNFVIIDVGKNAGIKIGDKFKVYRKGRHIGAVSVIQVREDIAAADIKQKEVPLQPGDTVK